MLCGLVSGVLYSLLLGYFVMQLKANTIITGIALNLAAAGGSEFLLYTLTGHRQVHAAESRQHAADQQCLIPNPVHLDAHRLCGGRITIIPYFFIIVFYVVFSLLQLRRERMKLAV